MFSVFKPKNVPLPVIIKLGALKIWFHVAILINLSSENDLVAASHVAARYGSVGSLHSLAKFGFEIFVSDINKVSRTFQYPITCKEQLKVFSYIFLEKLSTCSS